jgi:endonuclease/exonuclease/phosphatase family metal-dependent hydrolase
MKRAWFATLVLLSGAACAGTLAPAHPGTTAPSHLRTAAPSLAVVSWNLDAGEGDVAELLADLRAGRLVQPPPVHWLLLLQELTDVPDAIPYTFVAPVRDLDAGRRMGNAILSTLPLEAPRAIPLPRERQPRAAAIATVRVDGQPLVVVSVHLENRASWWQGGLLSEDARGRQARALLEAVPTGAPGVLGGDLNTWLGPTEPAWRLLVERFPDLPPSRRDVTFRNRLVLDHVLFDLPEGWTARRHVVESRYGSDHHPVLGVMTAP